MTDEDTQKLTLMMAEMVAKMQVLLEKQDELGENISKIKEAVYNPDNGLYARLSRLDARLDVLEAWKNSNAKIMWIMVSVCMGLVLTSAWQAIF
jgi:arginine decarboxylase-like protein